MAINKVVYDGNTLIDITPTTATASDVVSGKVFYKNDGTQTTGNVTFQTYYTGSSTPSNSLGVNGDVYIEVQ